MRCVARVPVANPTDTCTHIQVDVDHAKGGVNMLTGNSEGPGVWAFVIPVHLKPNGIMTWVIHRGAKTRLEAMARKSPKKLAGWQCIVGRDIEARLGQVWPIILKVAGEEGCHVAPGQPKQEVAQA